MGCLAGKHGVRRSIEPVQQSGVGLKGDMQQVIEDDRHADIALAGKQLDLLADVRLDGKRDAFDDPAPLARQASRGVAVSLSRLAGGGLVAIHDMVCLW